jgi:hypothetical protein
MIKQAHIKGVDAALAHFQIKTGFLEGIKNMVIGQPGRAFVEGPKAFQEGGMLSHKNVWWPDVKGKPLNWLGRASTVAAPLMAMSAMRSNPNEGHLSNALGALGGIAGSAYGYPALGMVGGPMLGAAGARLGRGIGHLLGSEPKDPYAP